VGMKFGRYGMRFACVLALAGSLAIPSQAALAQDAAESQASGSAVLSSVSADTLLTYAGGEEDSAAEASSEEQAEDGLVTIIVQLYPQEESTGFFGLFAQSDSDRHASVKATIRSLASGGDTGLFGFLTTQSDASDSLIELWDYYNVMDGFAVKAPASVLSDIQALPEVKNAFIEQSFSVEEDAEGDNAVDLAAQSDSLSAQESTWVRNQATLAMGNVDGVTESGAGQLIAVIDSSIQDSHIAFSGDMDDDSLAYSEEGIAAVRSQLSQGGQEARYVSEKIPFWYNYGMKTSSYATPMSSHGTHVAGIAAANAGQTLGVAPGAQIAAMGVDTNGAIYESNLLAALDDCAVLAPDVVNMSLGSDGGFSDEASSTYADCLETLRSKGCTVCVSQGNAYTSMGEGGTISSSNPDYGIVSDPASLTASLAVASVDNAVGGTYFTLDDGMQIEYCQATGGTNTTVKEFSDLANGTYALFDAHEGSTSDVAQLVEDVQQAGVSPAQICVLVDEGNMFLEPTQERVSRIRGQLGVAAIIVRQSSDTLSAVSIGTVNNVPVISVNATSGQALTEAAAAGRSMNLVQGLTLPVSTNYTASDYSSWGVTPELTLKPEISAPGGNIYSSVSSASSAEAYGRKSGTSMASPYIAGASALVQQYVETDAKFASLSSEEKGSLITQLLMGTARPLVDESQDNSYYSPRKQGAGMVDVAAATSTDVYVTVDGAADASRPKAELGDSDAGAWTFTVTLHNVGSESRSFGLSTAALSDAMSADDSSFALSSINYAGNGINVTYGGDAHEGSVTVPAGGQASVSVSLSCSPELRSHLLSLAENGTYVDGFAMFTSADGGVNLSVPFLAFLGDWAAASAFDAAVSDVQSGTASASLSAGCLLNANTLTALGVNPLLDSATIQSARTNVSLIDESKYVLSSSSASSAPNKVMPATSLLRNASSMAYSYVDASGNAKTYEYAYVSKSNTNEGHTFCEEAFSQPPAYSGVSDNGLVAPEGTCTLTQTVQIAAQGSSAQTRTYTFTYDTTAPALSVDYAADSVTVTASDSTYLAGISFHNPTDGTYFYRVLESDATSTEGGTYTFTVSRDALKTAWAEAGLRESAFPADLSDLPVYAWDYGLNYATSTATVEPDDQGFVIEDGVLTGYAGTSTVAQIPSGVTAIAAHAFDGSGIQAVVIPASVRTIGESAFANTASLTSVTFADAAQSELVSLGASAFESSAVEKIELPASVRELGSRVFASSSLSTAYIPGSITDLPASAFEGSSLATLVLGEGVQNMGASALANCEDLTVVKTGSSLSDDHVSEGLPSSMRSLGEGAFAGCTALTSLTLNEGLGSIGGAAFANVNIDALVVPDSVNELGFTSAGEGAFAQMNHTRSIVVGAGCPAESLVGAFVGDTALASIAVANGSATCNSVDGVLFSADGTQLIAYPAARYGDAGAYTIPQGVKTLAASSFRDACLARVDFGSVSSIGAYAFKGARLSAGVALPEGSVAVGDHAFEEAQMPSVDLGGATQVGASAFASCPNLANVNFRCDLNALDSIGESAFGVCPPGVATPLASVVLPDSVTFVGAGAFANNGSLTSVHLGAGFPSYAADGSYTSYDELFSGCGNISELTVSSGNEVYVANENVLYREASDGMHLEKALPSVALQEYRVLDGTVSIESDAFKGMTTLQRLVLPEGLLVINSNAFYGCTALSDVVFPDSLREVNGFGNTALQIADFGTNITAVYRAAFTNANPEHVVIRGGQSGEYSNSTPGSVARPMQTLYLGEGMTKATLTRGSMVPPQVIVVPSTLTSLTLTKCQNGNYDADSVTVYAQEGTKGWNAARTAMVNAGIDPATHLVAYTPLSVSAVSDAAFTAGTTVTVTATATGGVDGAKDYRFVQVTSDGSETVVQDWGSASTCSWKVAQGATLSAQVRDASYYSASATATYEAPSEPVDDPSEEPVATQAMYRLYNPNGGEHFYTASAEERDWLSTLGWKYEGIGWTAPATSDAPVYRLYNPNGGDHHYTSSVEERDWLRGLGWKYEGIGWYSEDSDGQALYRLYNPNAATGSHHYTTSAEERDFLASLGWQKEGVGWYGVK